MEVYIIIAVVAVAMTVVGFVLGNRRKGNQQDKTELIDNLHKQLDELNIKIAEREQIISGQNAQITTLTSERDVQNLTPNWLTIRLRTKSILLNLNRRTKLK